MLSERDYLAMLEKTNAQEARIAALERLEFVTGELDTHLIDYYAHLDGFRAVPLAISTIISWPNLRLFIPPSSTYDAAGGTIYFQNYATPNRQFDLIKVGTPELRLHNGWRPQIGFSGTAEYIWSNDQAQWDILGTETYVNSVYRGLTIGGWVWFNTTASANEYIISKTESTTNVSYLLGRNSSGYGMFVESPDGTYGGQDEVLSTDIIGAGAWVFMCGRFDPSTEIKLWLNEETYTQSIGSSSIYNGSAAVFLSGRDDTTTPGQRLLNGTMSLMFICGAALPDATIDNYYNLTKNIYDTLWTP